MVAPRRTARRCVRHRRWFPGARRCGGESAHRSVRKRMAIFVETRWISGACSVREDGRLLCVARRRRLASRPYNPAVVGRPRRENLGSARLLASHADCAAMLRPGRAHSRALHGESVRRRAAPHDESARREAVAAGESAPPSGRCRRVSSRAVVAGASAWREAVAAGEAARRGAVAAGEWARHERSLPPSQLGMQWVQARHLGRGSCRRVSAARSGRCWRGGAARSGRCWRGDAARRGSCRASPRGEATQDQRCRRREAICLKRSFTERGIDRLLRRPRAHADRKSTRLNSSH